MPDTKIHHVAVRLDVETLARLNGLLPLYELPGRKATMSDVLRALILAGLDLEEAKGKSKPRAGGG